MAQNPKPAPRQETMVEEVEKSIRNTEKISLEERYDNENLRLLQIENKGQAEFYSLRKGWSFFVALILFLSILFQFIITFNVGLHKLDYKGSEVLINLIMGENFVQILGLGYIIVNFLYPKINESNSKQ